MQNRREASVVNFEAFDWSAEGQSSPLIGRNPWTSTTQDQFIVKSKFENPERCTYISKFEFKFLWLSKYSLYLYFEEIRVGNGFSGNKMIGRINLQAQCSINEGNLYFWKKIISEQHLSLFSHLTQKACPFSRIRANPTANIDAADGHCTSATRSHD